jgi:peptidoglycan biosynthesis protein MviN/MurJ (putative lipid II flippase)
VAEGVFNVVLSVLFVKFFGAVGVIVATIATNLLICHVVEPYVLYKNAFHISPAPYYRKNYFWILLFTGALTALNRVMVSLDNHWLQLLANGFISVGVSLVLCLVVFLLYKKDCKMAIAIFRRNKV